MNVTEQIRKKIKRIPESEPFGYADLGIAPNDFFTAAKALERLQKKGIIKKVSKGVFYKPEISVFGALPPNYDAILKNYLYKNGKRVGYITGMGLYNQLNLTTQMAFRNKIATNRNRKKIEISWLKTNSVKAYANITEENFQLLGILDAIKDIKLILDTPESKAAKMLMDKIKAFPKKDMENLIKYALQYPPRVRALLGAMVEYIFGDEYNLTALKKSLNPSTSFKLAIKNTDLPTIKKWNIK
jgi:predicted transcriptional regulator of viral defense system